MTTTKIACFDHDGHFLVFIAQLISGSIPEAVTTRPFRPQAPVSAAHKQGDLICSATSWSIICPMTPDDPLARLRAIRDARRHVDFAQQQLASASHAEAVRLLNNSLLGVTHEAVVTAGGYPNYNVLRRHTKRFGLGRKVGKTLPESLADQLTSAIEAGTWKPSAAVDVDELRTACKDVLGQNAVKANLEEALEILQVREVIPGRVRTSVDKFADKVIAEVRAGTWSIGDTITRADVSAVLAKASGHAPTDSTVDKVIDLLVKRQAITRPNAAGLIHVLAGAAPELVTDDDPDALMADAVQSMGEAVAALHDPLGRS
ncbi:hypothetical protein ACIGO9_29605 [Nocardia asteroides]|uniref:hypothetical protein n=1 Tax=Nocardia asteroides TaxID=1824 RepID=UPI0037C93DC8